MTIFMTILIIICAASATFACARVFIRARKVYDRDALFTGAFGLSLLAMLNIYYVLYYYIKGAKTGLDISDFSAVCSYIFFIAALNLLLLLSNKLYTIVKITIGVVSVAISLITIYSVITDHGGIFYATMISVVLFCIILSVLILLQSRKIQQLKAARAFACSTIFLGVLDTIYYLGLFIHFELIFFMILSVLYILAYIWISEGLIRLRPDDQPTDRGGECRVSELDV